MWWVMETISLEAYCRCLSTSHMKILVLGLGPGYSLFPSGDFKCYLFILVLVFKMILSLS